MVVHMGRILRTLGLETYAETPLGDYSADVSPPARSTVAPVSVDRAISLPAVFRAVQITAGMGAQLHLEAWRGGAPLPPEVAPGIIRQPDPWRSLSSFLERVIVDLATDGNAFLRKYLGTDGTVATGALEVLNPHHVHITRDTRGRKGYRVLNSKGKTEDLTADQVEHIWGLELPGHDRGLGPIQACRLALTGHIDLREYAGAWFRQTDVPSGVLSSDQRLDPEAAKAYKRAWLNPAPDDAGLDRYGPTVRVLGQGLTYSPILLKPEDAQWLQAQAFGVLDVARMFGLPGDYLLAAVEGSSLTYANLEMIDAQYLRTTLFPVYLRKIEAALTGLLPRGQVAKFKTEALLRPDAKTRAEIDKTYIDAGVYDGDYVRRRDGIDAPAPRTRPADQEAPA